MEAGFSNMDTFRGKRAGAASNRGGAEAYRVYVAWVNTAAASTGPSTRSEWSTLKASRCSALHWRLDATLINHKHLSI